MSRLRAVAVGYQGFGNVGDEAILTGIEQLLAGTGIEVDAVIAGREPVAAFPDARRVSTRRLRPTPDAIRALRGARLLVLSGGGLLNDHWATVVPTYLGWVALARLFGLRVAWLGVGIGPLRRGWARRLAGWALRLSSLVTVRDPVSAALVRRIAPGVEAHTVPDPALFNLPPPPDERSGVGFVVRRPAPGDARMAGPLAHALGEALARLNERGTPVAVLTFGGQADGAFAEEVVARALEAGGEARVEELPPEPGAVLARLARLEALVSVRLHGIILGALAGTPAASVSYDPKVAAWADRLGLSDYCLPMHGISGSLLLGALDSIRSPDVAEQMSQRLGELRGEADRLRGLLSRIA